MNYPYRPFGIGSIYPTIFSKSHQPFRPNNRDGMKRIVTVSPLEYIGNPELFVRFDGGDIPIPERPKSYFQTYTAK